LAPLALVPFFLLGAALALFAAAVALPIRDVVFGLPLILTPAMFISPVLYPLPGEGMWLLVGALNPVAPMLTVLRALFLGTAWPAPSLLLLWSALALLLFVIAWRFFDYLVPRVTEFA
jgi:lipopolysaccharide transport system permease protein